MIFKGSGVAIITPFDKSGEVDYAAYEKLIHFHLINQTDAIIVCGTTGEAATMTEEEKLSLIRFTAEKVAGKIPVIAGTGSNNTRVSVEFSKKVSQIDGVDGQLVVTPYYNKSTKDGLFKHFESIANASKLPIILYNVPSRTNVNIDFDMLIKLSKIDTIVGIKDASGDLDYTARARKELSNDFAIYSGNDDLTLPMLALGIDGSISVFANVMPKASHDLIALYKAKKVDEARNIHLEYFDFIKNLFMEVNPVPVKAALSILGLCENNLRLPLSSAEEKTMDIIRKDLEGFNLC